MEDVELLDLKTLVLDDEEKWLYCMSSSSRSKKGTCNIGKWIREEFDYSTSISSPARKYLRLQLEEVIRNGRVKNHRVSLASSLNTSSSNNFMNNSLLEDMAIDTRTFTRPKKSSVGEPKLSRIANMPTVNTILQTTPDKDKRSAQETPTTNGDADNGFSEIGSRTFTRPGSERARRSLFTLANQTNLQADQSGGDNVNSGRETITDHNNSHDWGTVDDLSSAKLGGSCRRLSEVTDVQNLARVQEESLRKQCLTSALSMRHRKDADGKLKQRSLPNLSNESKLSLSAGNDLDNVDAIDEQNDSNLRYSPTLSSNGTSVSTNSSIDNAAKSRLDGQPADGYNGVRCESPTITLQKSGIPLAKSCLPRPSSASKQPAYHKGSHNQNNQVRRNPLDVSWREGCY